MIRLIMSDIDGTLLGKGESSFDSSVFSVIEKLSKQNIVFAAASGRSLSDLTKLFEPVKNQMAFVCSDGSMTVYAGKVLGISSMEREKAGYLCRHIYETEGCELLVYTRHNVYAICKSEAYLEFVKRRYEGKAIIFNRIEEFDDIQEEFLKVAVYADGGIAEHESKLRERWGDDFNIVYCANVWMEIVAKDTTKVTGLNNLLEYLGCGRDEVMAFGDGGNDVELLGTVAYGYAMDYAPDYVKEAAKYETDSVMNEIRRVVLGESNE